MLRLRVRPPGSKGYVVTLKSFPVQIGRGAASSLKLDDPFVSRLHAELRLAEGGPRLFDLQSGNGTFLNGLRVGGESGLEAGDRIRLGNTILELETEAVEAPARATRRAAGAPASDEARALAAREIKARLLPPAPPVIPGYELAGGSQLSAAVGGESFLFLELGDDRVLLAQADASGLALDAALLTASLHAALAAQADLASSVGDLAGRLNAFLGRRAPAERFVTLFLAVLDAPGHRLSYVNAGHPQPLLVRADGTLETLAAGGPALGVTAEARFEPAELTLAPGDVLMVASDSVLEARNGAGDELPADWLAEVARRYRGALASELQMLAEQELASFLGARAPAGDRTLVVLRRTP